MKIEERKLEGFLNDRGKNDHRSAGLNNRDKTLLTKAIQSRHFFKVVMVLPVLAALSFFYMLDRHILQKGADSAKQAIAGASDTRGIARVKRYKSIAGKAVSNKEPSLKELKTLSTSALASTLQSTSAETIQKNVLKHTGRQVSDSQIKKVQRNAGNSAIINRVDSARQSYSGSRSDAITRIRSKLNN